MVQMLSTQETEMLARLPLFGGLEQSEQARIAAQLRRRVFQKGEVIYHKEDLAGSVFIVVSGKIKHQLVSPNGRQMTLTFTGPGGSFGMLALLDDGPRVVHAVAARKSELLVLSKEHFEAYLHAHPEAVSTLLEVYAERLRRSLERLQDHIFLDGRGRLAKALISYAGDDGLVPLSQAELASVTASTRESINRWVRFYVAEGLLSMEGEGIRVLDSERLGKYVY